MTKSTVLTKTSPVSDRPPGPKHNGETRLVNLATKIPQFAAILDEIEKHVPNTGILEQVEQLCKKKDIVTKVLITRPIALDLLTKNLEDNRRIKFHDVVSLGKRMKAKNYTYNGDSIKFTEDGYLFDCQHRLFAILWSGMAQMMHIEGGFSRESIYTTDTGRARTAVDTAQIAGFKVHPGVFAAAIKKVIFYRETGKIGGYITLHMVENYKVGEFIENDKAEMLAEFVEFAISTLHKECPWFSESEWAALYFILATTSRGRIQDAKTFIHSLQSAINLKDRGRTAPIWHLRKKLEKWEDTKTPKGKSDKMNLTLKFKYSVDAWNDWVGEKMPSYDSKGLILDKEYRDTPFVKRPL